tara:strand:- start:739 stop:1257 length:519 start_codon:yes stop_codon:yes gene_type:complete
VARFDYPVPGQSLTTPPRNAPYERPPQTVDPKEALQIHISNLNSKESMEDIAYFAEMGLDVKSQTEALLRSAVAEGIHSIDVSLTIAPLLHQFIVGRLEAMGLEYDEGINNVAEKEGIRYQRNISKAMKMLSEIEPTDDADAMDLEQTEVEETAPVEEQTIEEPVRGLMART